VVPCTTSSDANTRFNSMRKALFAYGWND